MANPLFTPRGPPPPPAGPQPFRTKDGELSFLVPEGWQATGAIQVEPPANRYVILDATGPDDALIFCGHPDLPQRYLVPAPWHGMLQPGRRTKFGDGPTAQWLLPAPLATAPQMAQHLATRRFGDLVLTHVVPHQKLLDDTRKGAADAGVFPGYIDACDAGFASIDGRFVGQIQLVVFGGGNPGDTWQVEYISGFRCVPDARGAVAALFDAVMASIVIGAEWQRKNPDQVSQDALDSFDAKHRAAAAADRYALVTHRNAVDAIRDGILGAIKGRKPGGDRGNL